MDQFIFADESPIVFDQILQHLNRLRAQFDLFLTALQTTAPQVERELGKRMCLVGQLLHVDVRQTFNLLLDWQTVDCVPAHKLTFVGDFTARMDEEAGKRRDGVLPSRADMPSTAGYLTFWPVTAEIITQIFLRRDSL